MMLRSFRDAWSTKLREPGLPQARGAMRRSEPSDLGQPAGMCCIGVRCELDVDAGLLRRVVNRSAGFKIAASVFGYVSIGDRGNQPYGGSYGNPSASVQRRWGVYGWCPPRELIPSEIRRILLDPSGELHLIDVLITLNDTLKWTFPQIADWLDTLPVEEG